VDGRSAANHSRQHVLRYIVACKYITGHIGKLAHKQRTLLMTGVGCLPMELRMDDALMLPVRSARVQVTMD
jgi:hypothetical protein